MIVIENIPPNRSCIMLLPPIILCVIGFFMLPIVTAQQCAVGTAVEIKGNWYCSAVDMITYTNFPGTGSYNKLTSMDAITGNCETIKYNYTGSLAPLNEEVYDPHCVCVSNSVADSDDCKLSIHIRGPLWLKELAVYTPESPITERDLVRSAKKNDHHRHENAHHHDSPIKRAHAQLHQHKLGNRAVGDLVTATINGQVVHWINEYAGPAAPTHSSPAIIPVKSSSEDSSSTSPATSIATSTEPSPSHSSTAVSPAKSGPSAPAGNWNRRAYYNAGEKVSQGFTFLNHFGEVDNIPQ